MKRERERERERMNSEELGWGKRKKWKLTADRYREQKEEKQKNRHVRKRCHKGVTMGHIYNAGNAMILVSSIAAKQYWKKEDEERRIERRHDYDQNTPCCWSSSPVSQQGLGTKIWEAGIDTAYTAIRDIQDQWLDQWTIPCGWRCGTFRISGWTIPL